MKYMLGKNFFRGDGVRSCLLQHSLGVKSGGNIWVMTIVGNKPLLVFVAGLQLTQCRVGSEMACSGLQVKETVMA